MESTQTVAVMIDKSKRASELIAKMADFSSVFNSNISVINKLYKETFPEGAKPLTSFDVTAITNMLVEYQTIVDRAIGQVKIPWPPV